MLLRFGDAGVLGSSRNRQIELSPNQNFINPGNQPLFHQLVPEALLGEAG